MYELHPRETVLLAVEFEALVDWYRNVLGFEVRNLSSEEYRYCNLETPSGIRLGIADASEMGVVPKDRSMNTVVLQFQVTDVRGFFAHVESNGGSIRFGPSFDKKDSFWYGAFADLEGNPCWIVDESCP